MIFYVIFFRFHFVGIFSSRCIKQAGMNTKSVLDFKLIAQLPTVNDTNVKRDNEFQAKTEPLIFIITCLYSFYKVTFWKMFLVERYYTSAAFTV